MAINLNPGADAVLVGAATRAAESAAPKDYSKTFENVALNYQQTMQATAEMWGNIMMAGAQIAKHEIEGNLPFRSAQKNQKPADIMSSDALSEIRDKLDVFRDLRRIGSGLWKDTREYINDPSGATDDREFIDNPDYDESLEESETNKKQIENPDHGKTLQIKNPNWKKRKRWSRQERLELQKKESDFYADLQHMQASSATIIKSIQDGEIDFDKTSLYGSEWANALLSTQNEKTTDRGNSLKATYSKDGTIMGYTMYHDPSKKKEGIVIPQGIPGHLYQGSKDQGAGPILDSNGDPMFLTPPEIHDLLTPKDPSLETRYDKNNNIIPGKIDKMFSDYMANANGQPMTTMQRNAAINQAEQLSQNTAAWRTPSMVGTNGASFFEEYMTVGSTSAEAFGELGVLKQIDNLGELEKARILKGVTDIGKEGIDVNDFIGTTQQHEDNYKSLTLAMFNPGDGNYRKENTAAIYKGYILNKIDESRIEGWRTSPNNPDNKQGNGGIKIESTKRSNIFEGESDSHLDKEEVKVFNYVGNQLRGRKSFGKGKGAWIWNEKGYYTHQGFIIPNKESFFETFWADEETKEPRSLTDNFKTSNPFYNSIKDWDATNLPEYIEQVKKVKGKKKKEGWFGLPDLGITEMLGIN